MGQWTALDHWSNGLMPQCSANKKSPGNPGLFSLLVTPAGFEPALPP